MSALVETAFANGAPPRLLEGTRLVLRGQTRVVIMLRDPVDRYRSALAMENCRNGVARPNGRTGLDERKGPNRPAHNASEPEKTSTYHDRYAKPNAMKKYLRAFEAAEPRARFDEAFGPLVRSRYRPLCAELLKSFPDTLVPVKTEDFFADPMATANKLLATLGLPRFTMTASDLDSLHKREATCDVSSIFSRSNAATLRAWLATDGDLDLRDLGPGFEAMAWLDRSKLGALAEPWDAAVGPAYVEVATAADWLAYDPSRASAARDGAAVLPLVADIGPKFAIQAGPGGPAAALPLFVIAGAQKGGTTYLRQVLNEHPMLDAGHGWFGKGKCGSEIHLLLTMAVVANRIEAAGGISSPKGRSILASHVSRYANAFRFPTCRGVAGAGGRYIPCPNLTGWLNRA